MQVPELHTMQSQSSTSARKPRRLFTLIASLLVAATLVGVLALTFTFMHSAQANVGTAGQKTVHSSALASKDCSPLNDLTWNRVCQAGLVQSINLTQKLANGMTLTVKGAYADTSQIVLWYDATSLKENLAFLSEDTLTTSQGLALSQVRSSIGTVLLTANGHYQWTTYFDSSKLPANLQTVSLQALSQVGFVTASSSGKQANLVRASIAFDVPLLKAQTLTPEPAVTANGSALALDSVVVSHVGTTIQLLAPLTLETYQARYTLQTSSKAFSSGENGVMATGLKVDATHSGLSIAFDYDLTAFSGAWTLTLTLPGKSQPWIFHFTTAQNA